MFSFNVYIFKPSINDACVFTFLVSIFDGSPRTHPNLRFLIVNEIAISASHDGKNLSERIRDQPLLTTVIFLIISCL